MGSDLYKANVIRDDIRVRPARSLVKDWMGQTMAELWATEGLPASAPFAEFQEVSELMFSKENRALLKRTTVDELDGSLELDMVGLAALGQNLLAHYYPEAYEPQPIRRIHIRLEEHTVGIGFRDTPEEKHLLPGFAVRLLCEASVEGSFEGPLSRYFLRFGDEGEASPDFCGRVDDTMGFAWNVRHLPTPRPDHALLEIDAHPLWPGPLLTKPFFSRAY